MDPQADPSEGPADFGTIPHDAETGTPSTLRSAMPFEANSTSVTNSPGC